MEGVVVYMVVGMVGTVLALTFIGLFYLSENLGNKTRQGRAQNQTSNNV